MDIKTNTSLGVNSLFSTGLIEFTDNFVLSHSLIKSTDFQFYYSAGNGIGDSVSYRGSGSNFSFDNDGSINGGYLRSFSISTTDKITGGPVLSTNTTINDINTSVQDTSTTGFWDKLLDDDDTISFVSTPGKSPFVGGITINSGSGNDQLVDSNQIGTVARGLATTNTINLGSGNDSLQLNYTTGNFSISMGEGGDKFIQLAAQASTDVIGLRTIKDFNPAEDTIELPNNAAGTTIYEIVDTSAGAVLRSTGANASDIMLLEGIALIQIQMQDGIISGADGSVQSPNIIYGTDGNDAINGTQGDDIIYSGNGADGISAKGGNDIVYGGDDYDRIWGGSGDDVILTLGGHNLAYGQEGNDIIVGGNGKDGLWGSEGDDQLFGGAGDDNLFGGNNFGKDKNPPSGNDQLHGEDGNDRLEGDDGNDLLFGDAGNDQLFGGEGEDYLGGGKGNDDLIGAAGNDLLEGGAGNDFFAAGTGDDVIITGEGNDYYLLQSDGNGTSFGADIIKDFDAQNDQILFESGSVTADTVSSFFRDTGEGLLIEVDNSSVLLEGISAADLDSGRNFEFG